MNPYDVLGISPNASDEEVTRAYKSLAKRYHPDLNPNNPSAADRMGQINRAYDDVKAMRQRADAADAHSSEADNPGAYGPYDVMRSVDRTRYSCGARRNPMWMILAVVMVFFFVRMLLSILFGGYAAAFFPIETNGPASGNTVHTYGYYETIP